MTMMSGRRMGVLLAGVCCLLLPVVAPAISKPIEPGDLADLKAPSAMQDEFDSKRCFLAWFRPSELLLFCRGDVRDANALLRGLAAEKDVRVDGCTYPGPGGGQVHSFG